jgi:hypothetical protein
MIPKSINGIFTPITITIGAIIVMSHQRPLENGLFNILEEIIDVKNQNNYILETSVFYALGICLVLQYFF